MSDLIKKIAATIENTDLAKAKESAERLSLGGEHAMPLVMIALG